jgi:hypothetical protein
MVTKHTLWKIIAVVSCIVLLGIHTSCEIFPQAVQFKYDANGATEGDLPSDSRIVKRNSSLVVAENIGNLKKANHRFIGWNSASDGEGVSHMPGESILITGPTTLYAQWTETDWRSFHTEVNENDEVEIHNYFGLDQEVYVPAEIDGKPVVAIGDGCFRNNTNISFVQLPDSIQTIGKLAFGGTRSLVEIQMGSGIEKIGAYAFSGAISLKEIYIPDKVVKLEPFTFVGCNSLHTITIGASLTSIGSDVYYYDRNSITRLVEFQISDKNPYMSVADGVLYDKACETLLNYPPYRMKLRYAMPSTVRKIAPGAFAGMGSNLAYLTLSPNLERIDASALGDTTYLRNIEISENPNMSVVDGVLYDKAIETIIKYPPNRMEVEYVMPSTVRKIAPGTFTDTGKTLANLILSPNLERIDEGAFRRYFNLKHLILPEKVTYIGSYAFANCYNLMEISIPKSVEQMGPYVFSHCYSLTDIYCEADSKPEGWDDDWHVIINNDVTIHWGVSSD